MPSMHVSVFIDRADQIDARGLPHSDGSLSVTVRVGSGEIALFGDAGKLLEFGQAIVRECETFPVSAPPVHYPINDAVQHDEAMAEVDLSAMLVDGKCECGFEAAFAAPEVHAPTCRYRMVVEAEHAAEMLKLPSPARTLCDGIGPTFAMPTEGDQPF